MYTLMHADYCTLWRRNVTFYVGKSFEKKLSGSQLFTPQKPGMLTGLCFESHCTYSLPCPLIYLLSIYNSKHTHTHTAPTQNSSPLSGLTNTPRQHSSSGQSSSPLPISVIKAMPAMYTHQDTITMRKTENIPRLWLPLTTVIVLSKLVRGGRGGACCLLSSSIALQR
ncbi:hypothetical protein XENOCAPTIV_004189 [Xenoophorus captivus]|uniref:Uncharacterized protein n=1 Tax=Xenoophorus captivus TaxID=1517983 RepID=A0ABV0RGP3_9TELE